MSRNAGTGVKNFRKWVADTDLAGLRVRLVDANGMVVGRLAADISTMLQGKDKPTYDPSRDDGDVVVVINVDGLELTGRKWDQKLYRWHTGHPGGLQEVPAQKMKDKLGSAEILQRAVRGMLPKNRLRRQRMRKLLVYNDGEHQFNEAYMWPWAPRERNIQDRGLAWEIPEGFEPMNAEAYFRRLRGRDNEWQEKLKESLTRTPPADDAPVDKIARDGFRLQ